MDKKRLNMYLEKDVHSKLKSLAALSGVTMSILVRRLIYLYLEKNKYNLE